MKSVNSRTLQENLVTVNLVTLHVMVPDDSCYTVMVLYGSV